MLDSLKRILKDIGCARFCFTYSAWWSSLRHRSFLLYRLILWYRLCAWRTCSKFGRYPWQRRNVCIHLRKRHLSWKLNLESMDSGQIQELKIGVYRKHWLIDSWYDCVEVQADQKLPMFNTVEDENDIIDVDLTLFSHRRCKSGILLKRRACSLGCRAGQLISGWLWWHNQLLMACMYTFLQHRQLALQVPRDFVLAENLQVTLHMPGRKRIRLADVLTLNLVTMYSGWDAWKYDHVLAHMRLADVLSRLLQFGTRSWVPVLLVVESMHRSSHCVKHATWKLHLLSLCFCCCCTYDGVSRDITWYLHTGFFGASVNDVEDSIITLVYTCEREERHLLMWKINNALPCKVLSEVH